MPRAHLIAASLAAAFTLSPMAAGSASDAYDDAAREALHAEIRAYLLENPEVIFEAVAAFEERNTRESAEMERVLVEINAGEIFFDSHSWVGGNPDGDLTLVEFVDYRCSFCQRAFDEVMAFAERDGNIRLVMKEFPILGPQSVEMSRFAVAVLQLGGDDAYFDVHERLLNWEGPISDSALGRMAADLGLDSDQVLARMRSDEVTAVLDENRGLAQRLEIAGTPTFVLGAGTDGEMIRGMLPADGLAEVAAELRNQ